MPKPTRPRFGSMGVWPRKRAKKQTPRVRSSPKIGEAKPLAFPVYKAGMTHTIVKGSRKGSRTEGQSEFVPVTVLSCPPIKIAAIRLYKKEGTGTRVAKQLNFKADKELARKTLLTKKTASKADLDKIKPDEYKEMTLQVYTQPKTTGIKKTPELFEIRLGGSIQEQLEFVKNHLEKPIQLTDVFNEGDLVDAHAVTTGRGNQGPVKRFGIGLKNHKSEKGRRRPGSLGGWKGQGHVMYRVPQAGQTGYHKRVQYNNLLMKMSSKPEEVNPAGGFVNYGEVKTDYVLVKGSIPGPKKRMILLAKPIRNPSKPSYSPDNIRHISTQSQQGR